MILLLTQGFPKLLVDNFLLFRADMSSTLLMRNYPIEESIFIVTHRDPSYPQIDQLFLPTYFIPIKRYPSDNTLQISYFIPIKSTRCHLTSHISTI